MSYQIRYSNLGKCRGRAGKKVRLPALTGLCFLIFLLLVKVLWLEGAAYIQSSLDQLASDIMQKGSVMATLADFLSLILV